MINGYEPLLDDGGGEHPPVCRDCQTFCWWSTHVTPCEVDGCQCEACAEKRMAMDEYEPEMDDRHPDKLAVVAAEMETERDGDVRDLVAERFGRGRMA